MADKTPRAPVIAQLYPEPDISILAFVQHYGELFATREIRLATAADASDNRDLGVKRGQIILVIN